MRIRKHRVAVLLLLSALSHLSADEASTFASSKKGPNDFENDDPIDLQDYNHQRQPESGNEPIDADQTKPLHETLEQKVLPAIDDAPTGSIENPEEVVDRPENEPLSRPQEQDSQQNEDGLVSSQDYENPEHDEEETIIEEYSSSLATEGDHSDTVVVEADTAIHEGDDDVAETDQDMGGDIDDSDDNASQAVHEDGFRLPALPRSETIKENTGENKDVVDEVRPRVDDASSIPEREITETENVLSRKEEESPQKEEPGNPVSTTGETYYEKSHTHIEEFENTKESILEEVVIDGDGIHSLGSIGTTNTEEEVEDDEIVVLEDAKMPIGTTSVEILDEEDDDENQIVDGDGVLTDAEPLDENFEPTESKHGREGPADNLEEDNILESSLENTIQETPGNQAVQIEAVDDDANAETDSDTKVDREGKTLDSNTSADMIDDEDDPDSSNEDQETLDGIEEDETEDNDDEFDEDDEDLTDRVSVDYASKSAGALIIEKTSEFKGTSNLITGDRDRYAIVPCNQEKKQVVLSLSEDILVREIKLANYERFSSTVKDFQVKGSHTLGKWVDLGTYRAESGNGEQTFVLENPTWARYLKFKFLTHHGVEWYCTLSQIKVHGSNMVQGFHEQWESIEEENNEEQNEGQPEDDLELSNANEAEKPDESTTMNTTGEEVHTNENLSNTSASPKDDPEPSTEKGDSDTTEKEKFQRRRTQAASSIYNKSHGKPLDKFRNPKTFAEIIEEEMAEEKLFSDLYNLIPHTMSMLPAHSKNNIERQTEVAELRSVHQIGRVAIESLYTFGSRIVDDIALLVSDDTDSTTMASPRMNQFSNEYYEKRFASSLTFMMKLSSNNVANQALSKTEESSEKSSGKTITDGSTAQSDGSTQQTNETNEEIPVDSDTAIKSSAYPPEKEESSAPSADGSTEEKDDSLDLAIVKLLKDLPSAECLVNLNFGEFKNKISATRKSTSSAGGSQGGRMMEPIFKKLTDEIFALQTSLSVHDQFSKMSVSCYQRVILDMALEMEKLRRDQDERLSRLEEQILEPLSLRMIHKIVVSLVSTIFAMIVSSGTHLFLLMKDIWIPKILLYLLSKDTYEGVHKTYHTVLDLSNNLYGGLHKIFHTILNLSIQIIETLSAVLESEGWTKRSTYQEFLSAWSNYYDGGMVVVVVVLVLLICRMLMICSSIFRREKKSSSHSFRASAKKYSEERFNVPISSKKQKKKLRKSKHRHKDPLNNTSVVEGLSTKPSEESIPELKDGTLLASNVITTNGRDGHPPTTSPSVVSLDRTSVSAVEENSRETSEESIPELKDEIPHESNNTPTNGRGDRPTATSPSVVSLEE